MNFTNEEIHRIQELAKAYIQAKAAILYAEECDPDLKSNVQFIKELRDAFDHLMFVIYNYENPDLYDRDRTILKNLNKSTGHVYRAANDALDSTVLSIKEKIHNILKEYSSNIIKEVIPEYWKIKRSINNLDGRVIEHRKNKDTDNHQLVTLSEYIKDVDELKEIYDLILENAPNFDVVEKELIQNRKKTRLEKILIGILFIIIATIFTIFSGYLFNKCTGSDKNQNNKTSLLENSNNL